MKKALYSLLFGLLFIAVAVGYLGNAVGWWGDFVFTVFFPGWWTVFIIVPALCSLINDGFNFFNSFLLLLGGTLLLSQYDILDGKDAFYIIVAVLLLIIGLRIILNPVIKEFRRKKWEDQRKSSSTIYTSPDGEEKIKVSFGEKTIDYSGREFNGISLDCSFASITLNLVNAIITHDCAIDTSVSFGGVKILLPENVLLNINNTSTFGGVDNKHRNSAPAGSPVIFLKTDSSFGGIEIR